jgi:hypothetical protein
MKEVIVGFFLALPSQVFFSLMSGKYSLPVTGSFASFFAAFHHVLYRLNWLSNGRF